MPIALDPNQTVDVILSIEKEVENPPTFKCRFLTCRDVLRIEDLIADARANGDQKTKNARLNEVLAIAVVGWHNVRDRSGQAIEFSTSEFDGVLTVSEKWELAHRCITEIMLAENELKKSASQRESAPASSATPADAPATAANA